jgi:hypothetical protein
VCSVVSLRPAFASPVWDISQKWRLKRNTTASKSGVHYCWNIILRVHVNSIHTKLFLRLTDINEIFRRAPQQILRTHRNPVINMNRRMISVFIFPSNGAPVELKVTGENRSTRGQTCPSATLSTTKPTWIESGSKPGLRGRMPATNRLSHGTACMQPLNEHLSSSYYIYYLCILLDEFLWNMLCRSVVKFIGRILLFPQGTLPWGLRSSGMLRSVNC